MAQGKVTYRTGQNLEPVASAITSMGQQASKKDKPEVLGQKIRAISTDATATPDQVLYGQTFYSGGTKKTGNIQIAGASENPINITRQSNYDLSVFPPAKYFKGTTESGILLPIGTLRGQGYALQSEVDEKQSEVNTWINNYNSKVTELTNMTNDRNNWMNVANSRYKQVATTLEKTFGASSDEVLLTGTLKSLIVSKGDYMLSYNKDTGYISILSDTNRYIYVGGVLESTGGKHVSAKNTFLIELKDSYNGRYDFALLISNDKVIVRENQSKYSVNLDYVYK